MWPDMIVLFEPCFDDDLSLFDRCEPLGIENFPAQGSVKALVVAVLPWTARIDADGLDADLRQPGLEVGSNELRTIIRTYELWSSVFQEERIESLQNLRISFYRNCTLTKSHTNMKAVLIRE